jgi:hypothetical protein
MWRIQMLIENDTAVTFALSGRLQTDQVEELQLLLQVEARQVTLDLKEVDIVDREMVAFLSRSADGGVKLKNCPPYINQWIAKERVSKSDTNPQEIME